MHEKARAEQLVADARQAIEEQAGLDRVRPLISDLQQIVQALPSAAAAAGAPGGGGGGGGGSGATAVTAPRTTRRSSMPNSPATEEQQAERPAAAARPRAERREDCEDRYKRALADLDNYRKRSAREIERRVEERHRGAARGSGSRPSTASSGRCGSEGVEPENPLPSACGAVLEQMEAILERQGVRRVGAAGEPLRPGAPRGGRRARRRTRCRTSTVVEVARSGYGARRPGPAPGPGGRRSRREA